MSGDVHDFKKEVKTYLLVFGGLLVLTVVTVLASSLKVGVALGVTIALMIATIKGSLVACEFMHLKSEQKLVYGILILTVVFLIGMMGLILFSHSSVPEGLKYVS